jgi:hypothetical protein
MQKKLNINPSGQVNQDKNMVARLLTEIDDFTICLRAKIMSDISPSVGFHSTQVRHLETVTENQQS